MNKDELIDTSTELAQYINELAKDSGVPGIGLVGHFCHVFFDKYLESRFRKFLKDASVDNAFLLKIVNDEDYSNCLYSSLETVRRTHSKIGLTAIALIYRDYWDKPDFLISAMRAFAEISDTTIRSFIELYESVAPKDGVMDLLDIKAKDDDFYSGYKEGVELINRNFFLQTTCARLGDNNPIQGTVWKSTKIYYKYCKEAVAIIDAEKLMTLN
ncbi:hypothetical protein [Fibrobacter sp.]|uniref:hypothetical protein n=1 Tax=Fibrobacter sp. TaxID=35828 RepID=UPI0025C0D2F7|nr:hypothetical protein [Fibrobacter sp.]MBR4009084.1 hypothetical protein [Fibrobacter sp.]